MQARIQPFPRPPRLDKLAAQKICCALDTWYFSSKSPHPYCWRFLRPNPAAAVLPILVTACRRLPTPVCVLPSVTPLSPLSVPSPPNRLPTPDHIRYINKSSQSRHDHICFFEPFTDQGRATNFFAVLEPMQKKSRLCFGSHPTNDSNLLHPHWLKRTPNAENTGSLPILQWVRDDPII